MASTDNDHFYNSPFFQAYFQRSTQSLILKANAPYYTVLAVSDLFLKETHKLRSDILNKNLFDVFPGDPADPNEQFSVQSSFQQVINTKATDKRPVFKYEISVPDSGTETFFWSNLNEPVLDEEGSVAYIINTTTNITRQVQWEQTLRKAKTHQIALDREQAINEELIALNEQLAAANGELNATRQSLQLLNAQLQQQVAQRTKDLSGSEARLQGIFEQAPLGFCILEGPDLIITYANDRMLKIWNKTRDIIGQVHAHTRTGPGDAAFLKILDEVYTTGVAFSGNEVEAYTDEGNKNSWGYFSFIYQPIKNEQGNTTGILVIVNDVTETVLTRKAAERANEQLGMAVEAANLGSWYIHPETKALEYNPTLVRMYGYKGATPMTYDEAIGQITEEYKAKILVAIEEAITSGGNYDFTFQQHRFDDGQLIWLRSVGKITADRTGAYTIFSGVVMDITEQKKEEQRKNDFINMISHELKTPLTSLGGYIQILQEKASGDEDKFTAGMLEKSNRQIKRMTALINGFLDISRLESGRIKVHKTNFVLNDLIQETINEVAIIQPLHSITHISCAPISLSADRDKIGSVIVNLLSNAIKFSPMGHRDITIACETTSNEVRVSIIDKGIGIPLEKQQKIFERFYRATSDVGMSGFGIGLYLCAEIVELHQGQIGVHSEEGKGSTFYFTLPVVA